MAIESIPWGYPKSYSRNVLPSTYHVLVTCPGRGQGTCQKLLKSGGRYRNRRKESREVREALHRNPSPQFPLRSPLSDRSNTKTTGHRRQSRYSPRR